MCHRTFTFFKTFDERVWFSYKFSTPQNANFIHFLLRLLPYVIYIKQKILLNHEMHIMKSSILFLLRKIFRFPQNYDILNLDKNNNVLLHRGSFSTILIATVRARK